MTKTGWVKKAGEKYYAKTHASVVDGLLEKMYPVGAVYISAVEIDPESIFGGVWERISQGRVLVGVDETDDTLKEASKTGGSKDPLTSHVHDYSGVTDNRGVVSGVSSGGDLNFAAGSNGGIKTINHNHTYSGVTKEQGSNENHANWQPFFTVYMFTRIE